MYCSNCGITVHAEGAFCKNCGTKILQPSMASVPVDRSATVPSQPSTVVIPAKPQKGFFTRTGQLLLAVALALLAGGFVFFLSRYQGCALDDLEEPELSWQKQYLFAVKQIEDEEFEDAEKAFKAAIDLNDQEPELYSAFADFYLELGNPQRAIEVLDDGIEKTEEEDLEDKREDAQEKLDDLLEEQAALATGTLPESA